MNKSKKSCLIKKYKILQKIRTVKGTKDLYGSNLRNHNSIQKKFYKLCNFFNYSEISTPILEYSEVFTKSLGMSSDIVSKEMYNFTDQGNESLVLRPEGTAAVARALVTNSLEQKNSKFFYYGPMFRRERPQSGRLRQFHQLGVEYVGKLNHLNDLEILVLAEKFLSDIGIRDELILEINTLGNEQSRIDYNNALRAYLRENISKLSDNSKDRLKINPLRILDSKEAKDQEVISKSPNINDYLDSESKQFFELLLSGLDTLKINYKLNRFLVRGLDYYNHTAFEYKMTEKKSQNAVLAGGRYDGLVKSFGGDNLSGVGWAAGIERIILKLSTNQNNNEKKICLFSTNDYLNLEILRLKNKIQIKKSLQINFINSGNFKKKISKANKIGAYGCIIFGEEEFKNKKVIWKNFKTGKQKLIDLSSIEDFLNQDI